MAKTLIAFYSRADENYFGGAMRYVKVGNTEIVCDIMKELIPADSFKIEMKEPYSPVYMTCIEQAKRDLREKNRPELVRFPDSIDAYDTIVLAYPNYWGTVPMAVVTFLERFDFSGKTILPLCTNEGSGMGGSERIRQLYRDYWRFMIQKDADALRVDTLKKGDSYESPFFCIFFPDLCFPILQSVALIRHEVGAAHLPVDAFDVPCLQDAKELFVRLIELFRASALQHHLDALHAHIMRHGAHGLGNFGHYAVVRQVHDRVMERVVARKDLPDLRRLKQTGGFERSERLRERGDLFVRRVADHGQHCAGLHDLAQIHQLVIAVAAAEDHTVKHRGDHRLGKALAYERSDRAANLKHAHGDEDLDRLAHRIAAHAELLRQLDLGRNPVARAKRAGEQIAVKRVQQALHRRRAVHAFGRNVHDVLPPQQRFNVLQ